MSLTRFALSAVSRSALESPTREFVSPCVGIEKVLNPLTSKRDEAAREMFHATSTFQSASLSASDTSAAISISALSGLGHVSRELGLESANIH